MAPRNEELYTGKWLIAKIAADTTMEAYFGTIPEGAVLPAVRFHAQGQNDVRGATRGAQRILTNIDWLVAIVKEGFGIATLVALADALDAALHEATGQNEGVLVHTCVRLEPFTFLETDDSGVQYRHAGGLYRTIVEAK